MVNVAEGLVDAGLTDVRVVAGPVDEQVGV